MMKFDETKVLETVKILNAQATALFKASSSERSWEFDEEKADLFMSIDGTSSYLAGFASGNIQDSLQNWEESEIELEAVSVLDADIVIRWLEKHGVKHPAFSAWIYSVELLKVRLLEYTRYRSKLSRANQ